MNKSTKSKGFTLIELLIVIAVIAILAAAVYVALDPQKRFKDSRDTRRVSDVNQLLTAVKVHQVDNKGAYLSAISSLVAGNIYMIGTATTGCNATPCTTAPTSVTSCADLTGLATAGYLGSVPISPNGTGTWTASLTGYTISRAATGIVTVRACENENASEIISAR
jgi:prepilin-type N-terminal cleavage/methylation domain-containing protein